MNQLNVHISSCAVFFKLTFVAYDPLFICFVRCFLCVDNINSFTQNKRMVHFRLNKNGILNQQIKIQCKALSIQTKPYSATASISFVFIGYKLPAGRISYILFLFRSLPEHLIILRNYWILQTLSGLCILHSNVGMKLWDINQLLRIQIQNMLSFEDLAIRKVDLDLCTLIDFVFTFQNDNFKQAIIMGADQSIPDQPIYPQPIPICAIEPTIHTMLNFI